MTKISSELLQKLRKATHCGMMDCKNALVETDGDFEKAVDWLRKKGFAKALKKGDRSASQGVVAAVSSEKEGALLKVSTETDFVARNDKFQAFVRDLLKVVDGKTYKSLEDLKKASMPSGENVNDALQQLIAVIGEAIQIETLKHLSGDGTYVFSYVHNQYAENLGKIGVLLSLKCNKDIPDLQEMGMNLAMHVAATKPLALDRESLDPKFVEREKDVLTEQMKQEAIPEAALENVMQGKMKKFFSEVVLLEQAYIMEPKKTVEQALKVFADQHGGNSSDCVLLL